VTDKCSDHSFSDCQSINFWSNTSHNIVEHLTKTKATNYSKPASFLHMVKRKH